MDVRSRDWAYTFARIILLEIMGQELKLGRENCLLLGYIEQSICSLKGGEIMERFLPQREEPQAAPQPDPAEPDVDVEPPEFPEIHRIRREEEQREGQ